VPCVFQNDGGAPRSHLRRGQRLLRQLAWGRKRQLQIALYCALDCDLQVLAGEEARCARRAWHVVGAGEKPPSLMARLNVTSYIVYERPIAPGIKETCHLLRDVLEEDAVCAGGSNDAASHCQE
jgi:hypothetical protein